MFARLFPISKDRRRADCSAFLLGFSTGASLFVYLCPVVHLRLGRWLIAGPGRFVLLCLHARVLAGLMLLGRHSRLGSLVLPRRRGLLRVRLFLLFFLFLVFVGIVLRADR